MVVLSDDASTDGSADWVERTFSTVEVVRSGQRGGFGEACNRAALDRSCDVLAFLNTDVEVPRLWIRLLLDAFEDPTVFSVTPGIRIPSRPEANHGFTYFLFANGLLNPITPCLVSAVKTPRQTAPVGYGVGAATLVDAGKFQLLGGFDPQLSPYYFEDADLGFSAWSMGWPSLCNPGVEVWHEHEGTIRRLEEQRSVRAVVFRNQLLFTWKHITSPSLILRHLVWLIRYVPSHVYHGRWPEIRGMWMAFGRMPTILAHRSHDAKLNDREVMARARASEFRRLTE